MSIQPERENGLDVSKQFCGERWRASTSDRKKFIPCPDGYEATYLQAKEVKKSYRSSLPFLRSLFDTKFAQTHD